MVKKKAPRKKGAAKKKKPAPRRAKAKASRKPATKKKSAPRAKTKKRAAKRPAKRPAARRNRGEADYDVLPPASARGLGLEAGGQSGDTAGLSRGEQADSESVEELLEEGQAYEAGIVSGVENAPDADESEVTTRQFPEDDVPQEYLDEQ